MVDVSPKTYKIGDSSVDFQPVRFSADTKEAPAGEWTSLYSVDVQQGQGVLLGRGASEAPNYAEGFGALRLVDDAAANVAKGDFRITVRTAQGRLVRTLLEGDLEEFDIYDASGNLKDRAARRPLSRKSSVFETHEYEIVLEVRPSSTITVDNAEEQTRVSLEGFLAEKTA